MKLTVYLCTDYIIIKLCSSDNDRNIIALKTTVMTSTERMRKMKKMIALSASDREKMGLAGRMHMEKFFDKRKVVEETIKAFGLTV